MADLSKEDRITVRKMDEIFWEKAKKMESSKWLEEVTPIGGIEKAKAARDIANKTRSQLGNAIYVGDSITDVECFRLIRRKGGVAASFNGNVYAISDAEIAILSTDAIVVAAIAYVFNQFGKDALLDLVEDWRFASLDRFDIEPSLQKKLLRSFPEGLPKVCKITPDNMDTLAAESSYFRKLVRGEKIGGLG